MRALTVKVPRASTEPSSEAKLCLVDLTQIFQDGNNMHKGDGVHLQPPLRLITPGLGNIPDRSDEE